MIAYSYPNHVLAHNPKAYWRLSEMSGNFADSSGNGHTGIPSGSVTYRVAGPLVDDDKAITLISATPDYFSAADHADFDLGDGPLTLEAWIKKASDGAYMGIFSKGANAYQLRISDTNYLELLKEFVSIMVTSTVTITGTDWHHIVATTGSGPSRLFIDGADVTGVVAEQVMTDTGDELRIGKTVTGAGSPFDGSIDEVAIYDTVLTPTEVREHYEARLWLPSDPDPAVFEVKLGELPQTLPRRAAEALRQDTEAQVE